MTGQRRKNLKKKWTGVLDDLIPDQAKLKKGPRGRARKGRLGGVVGGARSKKHIHDDGLKKARSQTGEKNVKELLHVCRERRSGVLPSFDAGGSG